MLVDIYPINKELLPGCKPTCRRQCSTKFSENCRKNICRYFNRLNFAARRVFLDGHIHQSDKIHSCGSEKRLVTNHYFLQSESTEKFEVCKTMFLATLGLKSDGVITTHFYSKKNSHIVKTSDERGVVQYVKKSNANTIDEKVRNHIELFNPMVRYI